MRARLRSIYERLLTMTRVLPAVGFGRARRPPTAGIGRSEQIDPIEPPGEMHEQQHVDVPSRAVGKRPRN